MEEVDSTQVNSLLQPLAGASPCGPDLEQDNEFLELTKAAEGKPETQFAQAVPPNWKDVKHRAQALLEKSRDLHAAILWTRASVSESGLTALAAGLKLIEGFLGEAMWEHLHPLPDEGDPYLRMNLLALLPAPEGLAGDLRRAALFSLPGVGDVRGRDVEVSLRMLPPRQGEEPRPREQLAQMFADAVAARPALRQASIEAQASLQAIGAIAARHSTSDTSPPDWKPLQRLLEGIHQLMPADSDTQALEGDDSQRLPASFAPAAGLLGGVNSRADALRAIDMVCEFLDRTEPTNPAPLFLRRARRLISHSFLQLVKELAPEALTEVARVVGVNPDTVKLGDES